MARRCPSEQTTTDAKRVVEQWRIEGFFGKAVQNFQHSHKPGSAEQVQVSRRSVGRSTMPHGKLMITVLGGLAEFERHLILARTNEGARTSEGPRRSVRAQVEAN